MISKQCSVCSGLGYRDFVAGENSTTELCYSCDGTGSIQVAEPIREQRNINKETKRRTKKTIAKNEVNLKVIKIGWSIATFIVSYFISTKLVSDNIYVSGTIGIISALIMYKWYKILAPIIGFSLLALGIYTIFE